MTGHRSRRALLQTGALALVGFAGCTGGFGDDAPENETAESTRSGPGRTTLEESPTNRTSEETTKTAVESPLAVKDAQVQSSFFYNNYPDAAAVAGREGSRLVFVELELVGSLRHLPSPEAIALVADDRNFTGTVAPGSADGAWELTDRGQPYQTDPIQSGWIAFEVPAPLDAEEVALAYESNGRRFSELLDAEVVERLARSPAEFEVTAFDFPESIRRGESFELSVAVENASEVDGTFRAVLNQSRPLYTYRLLEFDVPANERKEWSQGSDWNLYDAEEGRFTLLTPVEKREAAVEVVSETTTDFG